jgi:acid phosphatase (class A)
MTVMSTSRNVRLVPLILLAASLVYGQAAAPAPTPYLPSGAAPDLFLIVPPAPASGDMRDALDRAIFRATRALEGSPRWKMSISDNDYTVPALLKDFSCSLGAAPTAENAPRLTWLLSRALMDAAYGAANVKSKYKQRKRPFTVDKGNICIARDAEFEASADYPSGHASVSWAFGLILAEMAPDRATAVLTRARAYGDSRLFCGVHNASAVEAGQVVAATMVAALQGSKEFRADLTAAEAELLALRKNHPYGSESCVTEAGLSAMSPYVGVMAPPGALH